MAGTLKKEWADSPVWPALLSGLIAPGVGQFVNREFKKGTFLLVSTLIALAWFFKVLVGRLMLLLPGSPEEWQTLDPAFVQQVAQRIFTENPSMFYTFYLLMFLLWGFGIADAYISARDIAARKKSKDETDHALG